MESYGESESFRTDIVTRSLLPYVSYSAGHFDCMLSFTILRILGYNELYLRSYCWSFVSLELVRQPNHITLIIVHSDGTLFSPSTLSHF